MNEERRQAKIIGDAAEQLRSAQSEAHRKQIIATAKDQYGEGWDENEAEAAIYFMAWSTGKAAA